KSSTSGPSGVESWIGRAMAEGSGEIEREVAVRDPQGDAGQRAPFDHPGQVFLADTRQDGVRQDRVDHAATALDLRASGDDQLDYRVIVREGHVVVLGDAPGDPVEL